MRTYARKNYATLEINLSLAEHSKSAVDRKELACIITNDISKAFDSLCHSVIVKKLEAYGFEHNSLNRLRSYFDNRVKIGDKKRGIRLSTGLIFWSAPVEFISEWYAFKRNFRKVDFSRLADWYVYIPDIVVMRLQKRMVYAIGFLNFSVRKISRMYRL